MNEHPEIEFWCDLRTPDGHTVGAGFAYARDPRDAAEVALRDAWRNFAELGWTWPHAVDVTVKDDGPHLFTFTMRTDTDRDGLAPCSHRLALAGPIQGTCWECEDLADLDPAERTQGGGGE